MTFQADEDSWTRTQRESEERSHQLFWARDSEILTNPGSSQTDLMRLMEGLGFYSAVDRASMAQLLAVHPAYSDELASKAIENLHAQWWGDDPTECRNAWETLESILNK